MATCQTSINSIEDILEISSGTTYNFNINQDINQIYLLSNDLDQSVFFNMRVIGNYSTIAISVTIFNITTLRQIVSLNVTQRTVNSSFSIASGQYYICIRPLVGSYDVEFTPTFIVYNRIATYSGKSHFGFFSSTTDIEVERRQGPCNRRLNYEIIEGNIPNGLTFLDNGLIYGNLPILDTDPYNNDLPTSNHWYHIISDSEAVTSYGRAYRFKVRLSLFDDRSTFDERWYFITIINDFSKNLAHVDKYEVLETDHIASFEDKLKLINKSLCSPCEVDDDIINKSAVTEFNAENILNKQKEIKDVLSRINNEEVQVLKLKEELQFLNSEEAEALQNQINIIQKDFVETIKDTIIEGENDVIGQDTKYEYIDEQDFELLELDPEEITVLNGQIKINESYQIANKGLIDYYVYNIDINNENDLMIILKDSSMFQSYLMENNIDDKYIDYDVIDRFNYKDVHIEIVTLADEITKINKNYIQLVNDYSTNKPSVDPALVFENNYKQNYSKLPMVTHSFQGFECKSELFVFGK